MQTVTTIGLDIAKSVFQVHGIDAEGKVLIRRKLKRRYVLAWRADSSIGRIEGDVPRDRPLPAVAVREQAFLVVVELLGCLGRELDVWSQDNGVDRASR